MGTSQSYFGQSYRPELRYFLNFDTRPWWNQDLRYVRQKHLGQIYNGEYQELFENEVVEHVWIYHCSLKSAEGAKLATTAMSSIAGVSFGLWYVPAVGK